MARSVVAANCHFVRPLAWIHDIQLGLNWGGVSYGWTSAPVLVTLILGVIIYSLFLVWEAKMAKIPIVPDGYRRIHCYAGESGTTFFSLLYYFPQYLQLVRGMSPTRLSLLLLPFLVPIAFCLFTCGQIAARTGHYRYLVIAGYSLWTVAQGLQCTIHQTSSGKKIIGSLFMAGVAAGMRFQTTLLAAQAAVSRQQMAVVTAVRNHLRLFGPCIALGIYSSLINTAVSKNLARGAPPRVKVEKNAKSSRNSGNWCMHVVALPGPKLSIFCAANTVSRLTKTRRE
ncbi:hypothetical protein DAEQUDRAFT_443061 [Daedalea quercina L-15889]|uniref:MFS general substrate transporter n=1 Tax=Daedalea quercina L-15889 TaxID=1314783 RepID=A0A165N9J3_9APHY|nr:hypothetical protein DAEQUDRAFT_443061 [Daedalea quercina L-15889]